MKPFFSKKMPKRMREDVPTEERPAKRSNIEKDPDTAMVIEKSGNRKEKFTRRKLAPKRPFPSVARSVNASGPKSSHHEGANLICVSRKTPLARYLKRCKELLISKK